MLESCSRGLLCCDCFCPCIATLIDGAGWLLHWQGRLVDCAIHLCRLLQEAKGQPWASPQALLSSQWQCLTPAGSCGCRAQPSQALQSLFGALAGHACPMLALPSIDLVQWCRPILQLLSHSLNQCYHMMAQGCRLYLFTQLWLHFVISPKVSSHGHGRIITRLRCGQHHADQMCFCICIPGGWTRNISGALFPKHHCSQSVQIWAKERLQW